MGLTHDPEYRATTFIVIDFEATTPKGYRPEPIEVAGSPAIAYEPSSGLVLGATSCRITVACGS